MSEFQPKKHKDAEGHEVPLASMIKNGFPAMLVLTDGKMLPCTISSFDKFSITVQEPLLPYPNTYFKHAIRSFTRVDD